ncbi:aspartyl aminopeptidase 4 [[Candida] jaroonii]|uniref:Aspartyl aminopeptidase 4 n=1 Tax=[Candida] jaroonii TaxID=467808 RepID=A0ACA9Y5M5_9ASCO|nr:aspartyl aminopeptidase 4 [[Candida] jaroonii]
MNDMEYAKEFIDFVNASPTPYHAVDTIKKELSCKGFEELKERDNWDIESLKTTGKYFVTRNNSSIIAFTVGGKYEAGDGFAIVGGHTDSPCFKIKPVSNRTNEGFIQIGVEFYGGILAPTWFDRDLSIAGRVMVKEDGKYVSKLVKVDKPLLRIPTLAIHLNRELGTKLEFNKEDKIVPIAGQVDRTDESEESEHHGCKADIKPEEFESIKSVITRHNKSLIDLIARELKVEVSQIEDFELSLFDTQKSCIGGINDEFIFSPRLDNLVTCYTATQGIVESLDNLEGARGINVVALFDHEEVGSKSAHGADSSFLPDILNRLSTKFYQSMSKSFLVSSDMAHGVNPNYASNYESKNKPQLNKGPVIKINSNQRYSTNSPGIVLMKSIGETYKIPLQLFVVRNDSPCGSTIGPFLAAKLGVRTLDLGNPQLSMHSIRETGGTFDIIELCKLFRFFFKDYHQLEETIFV